MSVKGGKNAKRRDVIADVKEIRPESGKSAIAYEFLDAFSVTILRPTEDMFREEDTDSMDCLGDIKLEFFPWSPLSTGRTLLHCIVWYHYLIPTATSLRDTNKQLKNIKSKERRCSN